MAQSFSIAILAPQFNKSQVCFGRCRKAGGHFFAQCRQRRADATLKKVVIKR
jgi:hypothetical protein